MGDGAADSAGKGESRVEGEAGELLGGVGLDVLLDRVQLGAASRGGWCLAHGDVEECA